MISVTASDGWTTKTPVVAESLRAADWDHLFGSWQAERPDIAIRNGLVYPRWSDNPSWSPMRIFGR
jgi:hypothetical protein